MVSFKLPAALLPGKEPHSQLEIGWAPSRHGRSKEYIKSCQCRKSNDSWHVQTVAYSRYHHSGYMLMWVFFSGNCLCPNTEKRDERFILATKGPFILDTVYCILCSHMKCGWGNNFPHARFNTQLTSQPRHIKKISFGRPRHRREDNIKMDLKRNNKGWCRLDSSGTGQNKCRALISKVMNLRVP